MRYPTHNGVLLPVATITEYHLVTRLGTLSRVFEDKELALQRQAETPHLFLVRVDRKITNITPQREEMTPCHLSVVA